ncbi:hypothetical protein B0H11DRAFT_1916571 [Mycena galericulata]|nr:hypothetical protein B0H11DRAFT_1916571 [Mycena galericulata]
MLFSESAILCTFAGCDLCWLSGCGLLGVLRHRGGGGSGQQGVLNFIKTALAAAFRVLYHWRGRQWPRLHAHCCIHVYTLSIESLVLLFSETQPVRSPFSHAPPPMPLGSAAELQWRRPRARSADSHHRIWLGARAEQDVAHGAGGTQCRGGGPPARKCVTCTRRRRRGFLCGSCVLISASASAHAPLVPVGSNFCEGAGSDRRGSGDPWRALGTGRSGYGYGSVSEFLLDPRVPVWTRGNRCVKAFWLQAMFYVVDREI